MSAGHTHKEQELQDLARGIQSCRECPLHRDRNRAVPGEGPPHASVMLIGEAPGEEEDRTGRPFVGRTGRFFNDMLAGCGLNREELFITSSVKCRPPGNRNPAKKELDICRKRWLRPQIEVLQPELIVVMGKVALEQVLDTTANVKECREGILGKLGRKVLVTYHPTAAMRFPKIRKDYIDDLETVKRFVDDIGRPA